MSGDRMQAVIVRGEGKRGDWNGLALGEVERPGPGAGEVLVQAEACSVNRADLLQRRGLYPPPPGASPILGLDFAGFVIDAAPEVRNMWRDGDRVFGIVSGGGYGRYLTVDASHLVPIPPNLSFIEAAASAEVFFTAFYNLFMLARIREGETLLVHGGGSGVGTAAIQLAKSAGVSVIITAGSQEKVAHCIALGADFGINYKQENFAARILEYTSGQGVDVVLDWIGAPYLENHVNILKYRGRLVVIGLMGGTTAEINLAPVLMKRLRIMGSVLRSQSKDEKAEIAREFTKTVLPLLESGKVRPVIDSVYPVGKAEEAHLRLRRGEHFGKVVLTWGTVE
jgi:NADPH:quinone reductase